MLTHPDQPSIKAEDVKSVLLVCTANICRSPMAEGVLRMGLKEAKLEHIHVYSAGTLNWKNCPASEPAIQVCADIDVDITAHRNSPLTQKKIKNSDLILVMGKRHLAEIDKRFPQAKNKTFLLGIFDIINSELEIDDPIGMPFAFYQYVLTKICRCVDGFIGWLQENSK